MNTSIYRIVIALIALIAIIVLSGCAELRAFKAGFAQHGAAAADEALDVALWTVCNGTSIGAVNRRFRSEEERIAYRKICPNNVLPE